MGKFEAQCCLAVPLRAEREEASERRRARGAREASERRRARAAASFGTFADDACAAGADQVGKRFGHLGGMCWAA